MSAKKASKLLGRALPPNAQLALHGIRAARRIGRTVRRRWPWFAAAAALLALMVGAALDTAASSVPASPSEQARRSGAPAQLWAAYQHTSRLWCHPESAAVWMAPPDGDPQGRDSGGGWRRADWRLVAAVGRIESAHAAGAEINAFGDVSPWIIGPALDGTNPQYEVVADTDRGAWDLDVSGDRAVGPMQILPETMARLGADANRDGMADPHNAWDSALTAARLLCLAGPDARQAILAYNRSEQYAADVTAEYLALVAEFDEDEAALLPEGLPLGQAAVPEGSPLEPAQPMMASVVARWAALSGFRADVEPHCVQGRCAWAVDEAPEIVEAWEDALAGIGAGGPVTADGKVLFAGDTWRWAQLPRLAADTGLGWPLAVDPPPSAASPDIAGAVPERTAAPQWWSHHLPAGDPAWTAAAPVVALPAATGAVVASPTVGSAVPASEGCVSVADDDGWAWELCGIDPQGLAYGPVRAGQMVGHAAGGEPVTVALLSPDGHPACPAAVFAHWADGQFWSPQEIDDAYAAPDETAETDGLPAGFPPELAASIAGPAVAQTEGEPPGGAVQEPESEPNPIRECDHE